MNAFDVLMRSALAASKQSPGQPKKRRTEPAAHKQSGSPSQGASKSQQSARRTESVHLNAVVDSGIRHETTDASGAIDSCSTQATARGDDCLTPCSSVHDRAGCQRGEQQQQKQEQQGRHHQQQQGQQQQQVHGQQQQQVHRQQQQQNQQQGEQQQQQPEVRWKEGASPASAGAVAAFKRVFSGRSQHQRFRHLVVLDIEATCNLSKTLHPIEIIELSAALVDTTSKSITNSFQVYVRPTEHPTLDPFCVELTGITQQQVDAAAPLAQALQEFDQWLRQAGVLGPGYGGEERAAADAKSCGADAACDAGAPSRAVASAGDAGGGGTGPTCTIIGGGGTTHGSSSGGDGGGNACAGGGGTGANAGGSGGCSAGAGGSAGGVHQDAASSALCSSSNVVGGANCARGGGGAGGSSGANAVGGSGHCSVNFVVCTWGSWDLKVAMATECGWRKLVRPDYLCRWVDLKAFYMKRYRQRGGLRSCVEAQGLVWLGRQHSGLDDATNTARLAVKMMRDGVCYSITEAFEHLGDGGAGGASSAGKRGVPGPAVPVRDVRGCWLGVCHCGVKAHLRTTKKPGANHGRQFYSCGHWTITRQSQQCGFFLWLDEAAKPVLRAATVQASGGSSGT